MPHGNDWPPGVDVEKLTDAVSIISSRLAHKHRRLVSVDVSDISQELWLFAWRKREKVREFLDRDTRVAQKKGWSALLTTLERAGERFCQKQKAKEIGYEIQDLSWYSTDSLKDWIAVLFNGEGVVTNEVNDLNLRVPKLKNEGFNLEATLADVSQALDSLDVSESALLKEHFGYGTTQRALAEVWEVSESTIQRRLDSGLKKMVDFLGGPRPW